jgi:hypothetical protein
MEKYEYMCQLWGGYFNAGVERCEEFTEGYHWFDSEKDRAMFLCAAREDARRVGKCLATNTEEGTHTRKRTVARFTLEYLGKLYECENDFGYAYSHESARFMFFEGNYSCDCNRSLIIDRTDGYDLEELDCGDSIKMNSFTIVDVCDND